VTNDINRSRHIHDRKAMKGGALEFLTYPFADEELLNAIWHATKRSEAALGRESRVADT
jgi:FixJ family two-component response regulator